MTLPIIYSGNIKIYNYSYIQLQKGALFIYNYEDFISIHIFHIFIAIDCSLSFSVCVCVVSGHSFSQKH